MREIKSPRKYRVIVFTKVQVRKLREGSFKGTSKMLIVSARSDCKIKHGKRRKARILYDFQNYPL